MDLPQIQKRIMELVLEAEEVRGTGFTDWKLDLGEVSALFIELAALPKPLDIDEIQDLRTRLSLVEEAYLTHLNRDDSERWRG